MRLLLATANLHKIREYKPLLQELLPQLDLLTLMDYPHYSPSEEGDESFATNAIQKAVEAAKATQLWTLADDSGLVVPALGGAPGVISARYGGAGSTDQANCKKLLLEMASLQGEERAAYYQCDLALATPQGELHKVVSASVHGLIAEEPRGSQGFGYDPLFVRYDYGKSFGELSFQLKNRISHRYRALQKLAAVLQQLLQSHG